MRSLLKSVLRFKFLILGTYQPDIYIYVGKDVRIRGYFSKSKGIRGQKNFWETLVYVINPRSFDAWPLMYDPWSNLFWEEKVTSKVSTNPQEDFIYKSIILTYSVQQSPS